MANYLYGAIFGGNGKKFFCGGGKLRLGLKGRMDAPGLRAKKRTDKRTGLLN